MTTTIRHITAEELTAFEELVAYVFAESAEYHEGALASLLSDDPWLRPEDVLAAVVDGTVASTLGAHPWQVRVNGRSVPAAGVTTVGTRPDFRRRGLQRQVMTRALEWHREYGQAFAMLWASFGAIYQRYGYGLASAHAAYVFDPAMAALREPSASGHRTVLADWRDRDVQRTVERLYAEYAKPRNLLIERSADRWRVEHWGWEIGRRQESRVHLAIASDAARRPRGYVTYTTSELEQPFEAGPNQVLKTKDFVAPDLDTWRSLWEYIRAHDLVKRVDLRHAAEDDPATDLLLEPRALQRRTGDGIWLRLVDVRHALEARGYEPDAEGTLVLGIRDELCPWNDGSWRVTVEGGQASVRPVRARPQVTLPVGALASLYSGFRSATVLARAGRAEGSARALRTADRLFATAYRPHVMETF